jgi:hypothetical protein
MAYSVSEDGGKVCAEYTVVDLFTNVRADSDKNITTTQIWGKRVEAVIR